MSKDDLQMVRGNVDGGYNLAVGEPVLLQEWLGLPDFIHHGAIPYPTIDGDKRLIEELRLLHPAGHIVVANGAKQALLASFYALSRLEGKTNVFHSAPHWPSYPTLAKMAGLKFNQNVHENPTIEVMTSPNNPDGTECGGLCDIWDAVYAHWFYGWNGHSPKSRIQVYSAAKLLGLSGARVGWLVTEDEAIAHEARCYVEFTTSGVGVLSQRYVADCLKHLREDSLTSRRFHEARKDMLCNGNAINGMRQYIERISDVGKGMFAWFKVKKEYETAFEEALGKAKVTLVSGKACGGIDGYYRMNMCHGTSYTENALKAIVEQMP